MTKMLTYYKSETFELQSPDCSYNVHKWIPNEEKYTCFVKNQIIEPGKTLIFPKFNLLFMDMKKGIRALEFSDCKLFETPKRLTDTFKYLESLSIRNCFLKDITRADLSEFKHLKQLFIISNEITELSADLFDDVEYLEAVSFYQNKITTIAPELLSSVKNMKYADFRQNATINACFAIAPYTHPNGDYYSRISSLNNLIEIIGFHCTGKNKTKRLKGTGLTEDLRKLISDEQLADLTLFVGDEQFKVHKYVMAARSPFLASMIRESPKASELMLSDFKAETFKKIIDFMCNENFPVDGEITEVYDAAGRLQINELKDFCAEELLETVTDENALEILLLSNKHGNYDLKMKAFNTIKKMFPDKKFKDDLADDPETIQKMLFVRKKLEEEFESLGVYEEGAN